jgi:LCP family protein required for cell wall assembly
MKTFDSLDANRNPQIRVQSRIVPYQGQSPIPPPQQKKPRKIFKIIVGLIIIVIIATGALLVSRAAALSKIFVDGKTTVIDIIKDFLPGGNDTVIIGEDIGQVNVLLLGIGGEGHDGPYLSDTIILAQIRPDIGEVTLTSIPRDYLVELPSNIGARKINSAFAEGFYRNNENWNEAGKWAIKEVEEISGLKIPYFAVVDFSGFEKAIDQVGGVEIEVERTFTDYQFPNSKLGYLPPLTFEAGRQHMSGKEALQFARSRHAAGPEGSDFARSQRQQKVISAVKSKLLQLNLISDAKKLNNLLDTFADHFHTNLTPGGMLRLYKLAQEKNIQNFISLSLDPETGLICDKILEENGAYVLTVCPGKTEKDVENFFKNSFTLGKLQQEKSVVWLGSSTGDRSVYKTTEKKLTEAGMTVLEVGYAGEPLAQTIYYKVNDQPATAEYIKNTLDAREVVIPPPGIKIDKEKSDVIVILGEE